MDKKLDSHFEAAAKELPGLAATIVDSSGKTLYHKAFGVTNLSSTSPVPYTTSTQTALWSCTKVIASIAALQLMENGKLSLSDPVEKYVPEIANIPVLDNTTKDANGNYPTRPAKTKPTILQLLTHTAGFTYDFFNQSTLDWTLAQSKTPHVYLAGMKDVFQTPLSFDPGSKYEYGINIDWVGFVVEAITGTSLDKYVEESILKPLGMDSTTKTFTSDDEKDRLLVHLRMGDNIVGNPDMKPPADAEVYGGGHYLISTLDDYSKLLATILNNGTSPTTGATILKKETVQQYLFQDFVPEATKDSPAPDKVADDIGAVTTSAPMLSGTGRVLPGLKLGWSCGMMVNLQDVPNGRKAGSGMWAGLGNLYYWIDPKSNIAGMVMTSLLPFMDVKVLELSDALQAVAYGGEVGDVKGFTAP